MTSSIRLYITQPLAPGGSVTLEEAQAHYVARVMRARVGDALILFNGKDGEWRGEITDIAKRSVTLDVREKRREQQASPDLWLLFAPIKHARIDFIAQKATELGVSALCPVITRHTITQNVNTERLFANAVEAAEQCERLDVPEVKAPVSLQELLANWPQERRILLCDESGQSPPIRERLATLAPGPWAVLIGPEGGFAKGELELLHSLPYVQGISLGPRILRADTAALAVLACFQAWAGDWQARPRFTPAEE